MGLLPHSAAGEPDDVDCAAGGAGPGAALTAEAQTVAPGLRGSRRRGARLSGMVGILQREDAAYRARLAGAQRAVGQGDRPGGGTPSARPLQRTVRQPGAGQETAPRRPYVRLLPVGTRGAHHAVHTRPHLHAAFGRGLLAPGYGQLGAALYVRHAGVHPQCQEERPLHQAHSRVHDSERPLQTRRQAARPA